jgi:DNA-binding transcriptional ArsR family regulator
MIQGTQTTAAPAFGVLSDATRRGMLEHLGRADASISALTQRFDMTLTGMKQTVNVLEQAGLVATETVGRAGRVGRGGRGGRPLGTTGASRWICR